MIYSVGIDLVSIDKIRESIELSDSFIKRVYNLNEIYYCETKINKYDHYAARFAAKEAFMKALGCGWNFGIQWNHIHVNNNKDGCPSLQVFGKANEYLEKYSIKKVHLSITHEKDFAAAIVLLEK